MCDSFDDLLQTLSKNNPRITLFCTGELNAISGEMQQKLTQAIKENTTVAQLDFKKSVLDEQFIISIIDALEQNQSLTDVIYDDTNIPQKTIVELQRLLCRNRQIVQEKTVSFEEVSVAQHHPRKIKDVAFSAAQEGDVSLLVSLVKNHPELLNAVDYAGRRLLDFAARCGQLNCIKLLLELGIQIDKTYRNNQSYSSDALLLAIQTNQLNVARYLLIHKIDVEQRLEGATALLTVKSKEMAQLLVENKADITALYDESCPDTYYVGNTILHNAVDNRESNLALLAFLLKQGLDVNTTNKAGETPLNSLCSIRNSYRNFNFFPAFNLLIQAGANPFIKNNKGMDAFERLISARRNKEQVSQLRADYISIRHSSMLVSQGIRTQTFFDIPPEIALKITQFSTTYNLLDSKSCEKIAESHFGHYKPLF